MALRARRQACDEQRRAGHDERFYAQFAAEIGRLFPCCPEERAEAIARHATKRRSGPVGRSAAGRALDHKAVALAVVASVRHIDTPYDQLLMSAAPRADARHQVVDQVRSYLTP